MEGNPTREALTATYKFEKEINQPHYCENPAFTLFGGTFLYVAHKKKNSNCVDAFYSVQDPNQTFSEHIENVRAFLQMKGLINRGVLDDTSVVKLLKSIEKDVGDEDQLLGQRLLLAEPTFLNFLLEGQIELAQQYFFKSAQPAEIETLRQNCLLKHMYFCLNLPGHWILIYVRRQERDSQGEIWILDSLETYGGTIASNLKQFLRWLFPDETYEIMNFNCSIGRCELPTGFPKQRDGISCGVFTAVYLDAILHAERTPVKSVQICAPGTPFSIQQKRTYYASKFSLQSAVDESINLLWSGLKPKVKLYNSSEYNTTIVIIVG